jgi:hypothetical protein
MRKKNMQKELKKAYGRFYKNWSEKKCGPKPTEQELLIAEALGYQRGGKVAFANAMMIREGGAFGHQIEAVPAIGKPQLNGQRNLINSGIAKKSGNFKDPETRKMVYKTVLTARGEKRVKEVLGDLLDNQPEEQVENPVVEAAPMSMADLEAHQAE